MTAPTTRETADHAEMAAMKPEDHRVRAVMLACESRMKGYEIPIHAADAKFALDYLLSEIAALRGERDEWKASYDRATRLHGSTCRDLAQAERQRDELRKALEPFAEAAESLDDEMRDHDHIWEQPAAMSIDAGHLRTARTLLANHGDGQ